MLGLFWRMLNVWEVRLSVKRKEGEDPNGMLSRSGSSRAVRRKSGDGKPSMIPQHDGQDDKSPLSQTTAEAEGAGQPSEITAEVESEAEFADDSTLSEEDDEEESIESTNCLIALFDKVSRIKSRWRCQLRHGIFHIEGRDYLFKTATGEFTF